MQVSKPTSHVPPPLPASTFSYRDNSYNTEQRKAVQSYPTSSYPAPTPSYTPAAPAPLAAPYSKPDFRGSQSYLDISRQAAGEKADYEPIYSPPNYGSKAELHLHSSPMASGKYEHCRRNRRLFPIILSKFILRD